MLCDNCIKELAAHLSKESCQILSVLSEPLNKEEIMKKTKLTYAITQRASEELKGSMFVVSQDEGRSKIFSLTDSGRRLLQIYKQEKER